MDLNSILTTNDTPAPARGKCFYLPAAISTTPHSNGSAMTPKSLSPNGDCKAVRFRLRDSRCEPKTFYIRPHDTTDSIMDTVKHLFGLSRQYDLGISLEDADGLSFIPSYDNFIDGMTVDVRIEESLPSNYAYRHSYNLRQSQGASRYPNSRSVSPQSRGSRSTSATRMQMACGRGRSLKRSAMYLDQEADSDAYRDAVWYQLAHQSLMPDDEEEPRTKAASVASADISVENIVEGSRRKRPKFSSDELPLFPPPAALPRQNGSVSSLSPTRQVAQLATPYSNRNFNFSHPTPPFNAGDHAMYCWNEMQVQFGQSDVVPTPAPTVMSCISDEDVAIQLMRLGNANADSNTASTMDDYRDRLSSDCGEYVDDGRSDTTELPDPLPLPDSPILYPRAQKFKSLDEILPSFDTTEPSDDENQPPDHPFRGPSSHTSVPNGCTARIGSDYDDEVDGYDDERDETYIAKEEDENDADSEEDLDDMPLKMRRDRKLLAAALIQQKSKLQLPKGVAKVFKRQPAPLQSKPRPIAVEPRYPISPASPPASRKPSVASSGGNKFPQTQPQLLAAIFDPMPGEEPRPRCQRCRKSKKGCDRQRPCQRCKDAGLPPDQCISEDEAGTRRGRVAATAAKKASLANCIIKSKPKKKKVV